MILIVIFQYKSHWKDLSQFGPQKVDLHGSTGVVTRPTICDCTDEGRGTRRPALEEGRFSVL
jgi:hypothetical protein